MKESAGRAEALVTRLGTSSLLDARRYYPKAQIRQGAEPNATFRVGADGETGDFNGLTLSASGPVFLGSRGFSSARRGSRPAAVGEAQLKQSMKYSAEIILCQIERGLSRPVNPSRS